jgi:uncharacterized protein
VAPTPTVVMELVAHVLLWQPGLNEAIIRCSWKTGTPTVANSTLDMVRLRLAAKEPELRRRGVRHLAVFGSVARGEDSADSADSDVDLAVEIEDGRSFSLIRMEEARLLLEDALRHPVDLGEIDSFRPLVRAAFERDRIPIF